MALVNDAGKLNQRCTFYSMQETKTKRDTIKLIKMKKKKTKRGTIKLVKTEEFSCWCNIRQARISEVQESIGTEHINKTTLIIRHRQKKTVLNDWIVELKGRTYEIISIVPDFEKQEHDMIVLQEKF